MNIPQTSVTLLTAIAESSDSPRWYEFYNRYQPMMAQFLLRYPGLNADDVIQETMLVFIRKIPDYQYNPETKGRFHSYLLKILKYKVLEALRRSRRDPELVLDLVDDSVGPDGQVSMEKRKEEAAKEEEEFHAACAELAVRRYLNDATISMRDREIVRRIRNGESPDSVASAYGITRNNVDQIKARAVKRIREMAEDIEDIAG